MKRTAMTTELPTMTERQRRIIEICCEEFDVLFSQVMSLDRDWVVTDARNTAMWIFTRIEGKSLNYVSRMFGRKDHVSASNGRDRVEQLRETEPGFRRRTDAVVDRVKRELWPHDNAIE